MSPPHENLGFSEREGFEPSSVLADLRRLCPAEPEGAGVAREIRADIESESLARIFDEKGAVWPEVAPPQGDELTGGEHFVYLDAPRGRVFKSTKAGKFGFGAGKELIHALPSEYLARLAWQNELFGDAIRVIGMAEHPNGLSVLIAQPFVWGERTPQDRIDEWFEALGWRKIPRKDGAFHHPHHDLLILDALPRNVLTRPDGTLFPFDVVIVRPDADLKWSLGLKSNEESSS